MNGQSLTPAPSATTPQDGVVAATPPSALRPSPLFRPPPAIPDHTLLHPIGRGAYGEVWLARHYSLGTLRAVKLVRRAEFEDERPFRREFEGIRRYEPISRSHPHLIPILHVGHNDAEGWFYYVMELADGANAERGMRNVELKPEPPSASSIRHSELRNPHSYLPLTLAALMKSRGALPLDECLAIARTLAGALVELHRHGLVHRDIKPSNIVFVGGVPKLADVGLVAAARGVGQDRSFVGTEGFIPPEGPGTAAADLYSLGIVLYVLGTGQSHRDFPEPPADLATRPDRERERWLEFSAIIHRACQADPRARYASAEELLTDLERLAKGGSVRRRMAWQRRRRFAFALVGAAAVIAAAWFAFSHFNSPGVRPSAPSAASVVTFETSGATDPEAFHRYLQAREAMRLYSTNGYLPAITQLEAAVARDPGFARAWTQLALARFSLDALCFQAPAVCKPPAREAALQALKLDPSQAKALELLGRVQMEYERDWEGAERTFRRAVELAPDNPETHVLLAGWLSQVGRHDEAIRELDSALRLNPNLSRLKWKRGVVLLCAGHPREAEQTIREAIRLDPNDAGAHHELAQLLWSQGRLDEAMNEFTTHSLLMFGIATINQAAHEAYRRGGLKAYAGVFRDFAELRQSGLLPQGWLSPVIWADAHMHAGDFAQAFRHLERACEERDGAILDVVAHPYWRPLWADARFDEILRRTGLDKYHPERMHKDHQRTMAR